jgi:signal transduction histidine kinase
LKIVICRILQESLNNISKHSRADTVRIGLRREKDALELSVTDNGQGFDAHMIGSEKSPSGGMGLESMRDRTELSDGTFEILSEKGKGTTIRASWSTQ